ncbi:hypothetical protein ACGYJ8_14590 [Sulfitobacter sp. 1A12126]|uniref:hypothetical protein n=1 Tax=Sulfitobacter sp. 1A12126 TaxID=3368591 RepID=UPI0037453628
MDWSEFLQALGGGPLAVGLLALGFVTWRVLNWNREDAKEHNATIVKMQREVTEAMHASTEATRALAEEVRRRG